jgi:hypothetical protein
MRAQILYKSLLKRYAPILLNFSSMEIPSEAKEYNIPISLKLTDDKGTIIFEDQFEWDILNESNEYGLVYAAWRSSSPDWLRTTAWSRSISPNYATRLGRRSTSSWSGSSTC